VELLLATTNPGKLREFADLLGSDRFTWRTLSDFPKTPTIEETGHTFRANAILKATGYAQATGKWTLADDSGLEVTALSGKPGIHSARWAQEHNAGFGDSANNQLLLSQLHTIPDENRAAQFVCVLALADPTGQIILTARDTVVGRILRAAVGSNGFGYDPLFYVDAYKRTTAELSPTEKHQISHRGKALRRLKNLLDRIDLANVVKGRV
jgi:non-canonical purine NTP pyrophosphatase (RdgB/HAM1 family)